jgi:iron-sulfur cluster repair protein YtfE (RIC family)
MSAKNKKLKELVEQAKEAINEVHGFTDVSQESTLEALEELASELETKIMCLREELK